MQLRPLMSAVSRVKIVLDPDRLLGQADFEALGREAKLVTAGDWLALRRSYEQSGRGRRADDLPLVMVVSSDDLREPRDLPWDVDQGSEVVRIRCTAPGPVRQLILTLPEGLQDQALEASSGRDPLLGLMLALWGIGLPESGASDLVELEAVIRLRTDPTTPSGIWPLVRPRLRTALASSLAAEPPDPAPLQAAWVDWIASAEASAWHSLFSRLSARVAALFYTGFLTPVAADRVLPDWAAPGARQPTHHETARALLVSPPVKGVPGSLADWIGLAAWWGELRLEIALASPESSEEAATAWELWEPWDRAFREFLHTQYGLLLSSSSGQPQTVHRVASFLSRRIRDGATQRVMLVVFDGMGFPQWTQIRRATGVHVHDFAGVLAMAPTLTPISRRAIFAGHLPQAFGEALMDIRQQPAHEEQLWRKHWESEGIPVTDVGYKNIEGTGPQEVPRFGDKRAVGIVVRAIDEMMHTSEMLGDAQFAANVETWLKHGFLDALLGRAAEDGFEIWFTADHGSLPVVPQGRPMEGLAVDTAGTRVRLYATEALRDQSKADGDAWDPPGMPSDGPFALFPWGRFGLRHDVRVTHGGLSLDEMIVPFVRVAP